MRAIEFKLNANIEKVSEATLKLKEYSRKGIVKSYLNDGIPALNIVELCSVYDNIFEGRSDFVPEFFPKLNGVISLEKSKEFWGENWNVIFGENGEHWGKTLDDVKLIPPFKLRNYIKNNKQIY